MVLQYASDSDAIQNLSNGKQTVTHKDNFDFSEFQYYTAEKLKCFFTLPLRSNGEVIGLLNLASTKRFNGETPVELLLELVAAQIENAIDRISSAARYVASDACWRSLMDSATGFVVYRLVYDPTAPYRLRNTHVSPSIEAIMGYKPDEWQVSSYYDNIHPEDQERVRLAHQQAFETNKFEAEARVYNPKADEYVWLHAISIAIMDQDNAISHVNGLLIDVTEKQKALLELENNSAKLNQLNSSLNLLLEKREKDRLELEQSFVYNIKEMVLPYVHKMQQIRSRKKIHQLLDVVEMNLQKATSRFMHRLSINQFGLSPAELRVVAYVQQGKTSKEIASILGLSTKTIKNQREKIRRKLGINNKKINLRSHLLTLHKKDP